MDGELPRSTKAEPGHGMGLVNVREVLDLSLIHIFASGGTDFDGKNAANKDLFGGGSGAGVNIQPVAFLVVKDGCVRTIQLSDGSNTVDRALTMPVSYTHLGQHRHAPPFAG